LIPSIIAGRPLPFMLCLIPYQLKKFSSSASLQIIDLIIFGLPLPLGVSPPLQPTDLLLSTPPKILPVPFPPNSGSLYGS
jgi:hypothetical protein